MVLALAFHTKDPDGVGDKVDIFLFTDLSPAAGLGVALLTSHWGAVFGGSTLTYFSNISILLVWKKVVPVEPWYEAS